MIASTRCCGQTIETDTAVLKHLYKEAASAFYLRKDTALCNQIIEKKDSLLINKDFMIANRNEEISVCNQEKEIQSIEIKTLESQNKKLNRKVALFKTGTIAGGFTVLVLTIKLLL